jgi:hypothetical protein
VFYKENYLEYKDFIKEEKYNQALDGNGKKRREYFSYCSIA